MEEQRPAGGRCPTPCMPAGALGRVSGRQRGRGSLDWPVRLLVLTRLAPLSIWMVLPASLGRACPSGTQSSHFHRIYIAKMTSLTSAGQMLGHLD